MTEINPKAEIAVVSSVIKAGTGKSNPVFDKILREQLTDEEAAALARIATTNISGGRIDYAAQEQIHPDTLMAAQHNLGVNPALTGVVDLGDGATLLTRKGSQPASKLIPPASSETVAVPLRNELTHQERHTIDGIEEILLDSKRGGHGI